MMDYFGEWLLYKLPEEEQKRLEKERREQQLKLAELDEWQEDAKRKEGFEVIEFEPQAEALGDDSHGNTEANKPCDGLPLDLIPAIMSALSDIYPRQSAKPLLPGNERPRFLELLLYMKEQELIEAEFRYSNRIGLRGIPAGAVGIKATLRGYEKTRKAKEITPTNINQAEAVGGDGAGGQVVVEAECENSAQTNDNDIEYSRLLNVPKKVDDWFTVIDDMTKEFYKHYRKRPNEPQAWGRLWVSPPEGYEITTGTDKGEDCLCMPGNKSLGKSAFSKRWEKYTANKP